jgi:hypothetical protein
VILCFRDLLQDALSDRLEERIPFLTSSIKVTISALPFFYEEFRLANLMELKVSTLLLLIGCVPVLKSIDEQYLVIQYR